MLPPVLLLHLILLAITSFTLWPEMVVYPYLLNNSFLLYKDIVNPYPPFLTFGLAVFAKIFGYTPFPYQILTWGLILIIDLLIFKIARVMSQSAAKATISVLFFSILSLSFQINGLWFDLVQTPLILISFYYFYAYNSSSKFKYLSVTSLSLAIAFFVKQQVLWLAFWFLLLLLIKRKIKKLSLSQSASLLLLPIVIFVLMLILFKAQGNLKEFLFWTIYFPFVKASQMPGYFLAPNLKQLLIVGLTFLIFTPQLAKRDFKNFLIVSTAMILTLFAYPRFDYFHLIPSLAVLSLVFPQNLDSLLKNHAIVKAISAISMCLLLIFTLRYLSRNLTREVRFFEPEIYQAAANVSKLIPESQPVFIQNGPDQLLPLSSRLPTKPWAIQFPWYLEITEIQNDVTSGLVKDNPQFIISKPYTSGDKYGLVSYHPIVLADYIETHYRDYLQISDTLWLKIRK